MYPKNQICSYGAHYQTVVEKHKSFVQLPVWRVITYLEVWCYCFCLINEMIFVYFFDEIGDKD